jgi:hypothetical protein
MAAKVLGLKGRSSPGAAGRDVLASLGAAAALPAMAIPMVPAILAPRNFLRLIFSFFAIIFQIMVKHYNIENICDIITGYER